MRSKLARLITLAIVLFLSVMVVDLEPVKAQGAPEVTEGFVSIPGDHELFVRYTPAAEGKATFVILHGLTYTLKQWEAFARHFTDRGYGVVLYDMYGMGETLKKYGPILKPISHSEQVRDLEALLTTLRIRPPFNLVGLSYGSGIATAFAESYPSKVSELFLMAPYTEPLREQDQQIKTQIAATRAAFPYNPYSNEELYDFFLRQTVYATYPAAEPVVLEHPYKLEAVFRMVQGIRMYRGIDSASSFPNSGVHLMIPTRDEYVSQETYARFWTSLPEEKRGSLIYLKDIKHKVPEIIPAYAAEWILRVQSGGDEFHQGRQFQGLPSERRAVSGDIEIDLTPGSCRGLF